jgi:hypothetical protein
MEEEPLNHHRTGLVIHDSLSTCAVFTEVLARLDSWPCRPVTSQGLSILIPYGHVAYPTKVPTRPQ